jgi:hypothetical protein
MNVITRWLISLVPALLVVGCTGGTEEKPRVAGPTSTEEATIQASLAKLDPADRKLAEAQRFCAVMKKNRLGTMDTPYKIMVKGEPVFLCCDGCADNAQADPEKTLARVRELKAKSAEMVAK